MLSGLYSAATGMNAAALRQDLLAHNLAHANVPGFKRSQISFESFGTSSPDGPSVTNMGTRVADQVVDFGQGALDMTGRKLDLAISGDGFFVVDGPDGRLFTRNGVFQKGPGGGLVTSDGYTVAGSSTIPSTVAAEDIHVEADGSVVAGGVQVGQLEIVSFADTSRLVPVSTTAFQAPPGEATVGATGVVLQGAREGANVSPVLEMVQMMAGMRQHEASTKAFQVLAEAVQQHTSRSGGGS